MNRTEFKFPTTSVGNMGVQTEIEFYKLYNYVFLAQLNLWDEFRTC